MANFSFQSQQRELKIWNSVFDLITPDTTLCTLRICILGAVHPWACVVARPKKELCKDCAGSAMGQVLLGWRQPLLLLVVLYYNVVKGQSAREIDTLVWPLNTHRQAVYYAGYYAGTQHSVLRMRERAANGTALWSWRFVPSPARRTLTRLCAHT